MAQIKIRIGATKDRSVDAVFTSIEERAAQSAVRIRKAMQGAFNGIGPGKGGAGGAGGGAIPRVSEEEKAAKKLADAKIREERRVAKEAERLARWRSSMQNRHFQEEARTRMRAERQVERDALRERRQFAERTSHRATRFLTPNAPIGSMATRAMGDFARGAGVDFSIAGSVGRGVALERAAVDLSNSGYQQLRAGQTEGPNNRRVDPRELMGQARGVADKYGLDAGDALGGLAQFQKITGDLDTGRKMLDDMAKLSAATGTNLTDMAAAAANVSNGLGDMPDKAAVIDKVMKTIAGQGKLGAVEISDLATQMARVAASASQFSGDKASNIEKMGALAQIARATGGAPSAAEAARSVVGFANTLKKSARINEFKAQGIDVFADKGKTKFKDPIELIKESLLATGGNMQEMNKLFMDVIGARGVAGLSKTFSEAGGGKTGIAAVEKELDKYLQNSALSQEEINESAKRASESAAAKAARFQNRLDEISQKVAEDLIPALEKVAPLFLQFAEVLGKIASWSIDNPGQAIVLAITASIARAGLESALRTGIERIIMGGPGGTGGYDRKAGLGGGIGAIGNVTAALNIASLGIAAFYVGKAIIDELIDNTREKRNKEIVGDVQNETLTGEVQKKVAEGDTKGAIDLQTQKRDQDARDVEKTKEELNPGLLQSAFESAISFAQEHTFAGKVIEQITGSMAEAIAARDAANQATLARQQEELVQSNKLLQSLLDAVRNNGGSIGGRQDPPMPGGP